MTWGHSAFRIRPFDPVADVPILLRLITAIEAADPTGQDTSEAALRAEFAWQGHDPAQDRWVITTADEPDTVVGHAWTFAQTAKRSVIYGAVHPAYRRQGLGTTLLEAAVLRARAKGANQIVAIAISGSAPGHAFLLRHSFRPAGTNRFYDAPADIPLPAPVWPPGFTVHTHAELDNLALLAAATNACYADMWGHAQNTQPSTADSFAATMQKYPDYFFPEGIFVILDAADKAAGVCFARPEDGAKVIDSPGVAPVYRELDLVRPLTLTALRWLAARQSGPTALETWGDTPRAAAIYETLGFRLRPYGEETEYLLA